MTNNVVIHTRTGRVDRVKAGEIPKVELELLPQQYICTFRLERVGDGAFSERKTVDWKWVAHVVERIV